MLINALFKILGILNDISSVSNQYKQFAVISETSFWTETSPWTSQPGTAGTEQVLNVFFI